MKDNKGTDPFEDIFRNKFDDFEFEPSKEAWEGIRAQIIDDSKYKFPFWYLPAALVAGLTLFMFIWQWSGKQTKEQVDIPEITPNQTLSKANSSKELVEPQVKSIYPQLKPLVKHNVVLQHIKRSSSLMQTHKIELQPRSNKSNNVVEDKLVEATTKTEQKTDGLDNMPEVYLKTIPRTTLKESNLLSNKFEMGKTSNEFVAESIHVNGEPSNLQIIHSDKKEKNAVLLIEKAKIRPLISTVDILWPSVVFVQNTPPTLVIDKVGQLNKKPTFYISAMPMYSYYSVRPNTSDDQLVKDVKLSNSLGNGRLGINLQLGTKWPISKKLSIRTALNYTQLNENLNYQSQSVNPISYNQQVIDNNSISVTPVYEVKNLSSIQNWNMLGVGIDFQYQVFQIKNTKHFVSLGRDLNVILPSDGIRRLNGFVNLSYGINQKIGQGLILTVEPTLNYSLRSKSDIHGLLNLQPYSMGLKFSLGVALQ